MNIYFLFIYSYDNQKKTRVVDISQMFFYLLMLDMTVTDLRYHILNAVIIHVDGSIQ
jgi:hypothetical protein